MCPGCCDVITKELVTTLSLLLFPGTAAAYPTSQHCLASSPASSILDSASVDLDLDSL